jgi:predicted pyridoxine 5'-phosphate oxidase superfamily flavin-nucleotide-binding protein
MSIDANPKSALRVAATSSVGSSAEESPFHAGEQAVQQRVGVRQRLEQVGQKVIRDFMPDQHRELFAQLPFLILGGLDAERRPWASLLFGFPGFVGSPDPRTLRIDARPGFGDPLGAHIGPGAPLGLLGIELPTRRRNRMNGKIVAADADGFTVHVEQSFGNCPQYIQARIPALVAEPASVAAPRPVRREGASLSAAATAIVRGADTLFIATFARVAGNGRAGDEVDVSHRGGRPGFVRVTEEQGGTLLTAPDFRGNFYFMTLGNIALEPRAGLLFVDFPSGTVLSLTGEADVVWDGPEVDAFAGAQRLLRFRVSAGVLIENAVPLRWSVPEPAPQLAATGTWAELPPAVCT